MPDSAPASSPADVFPRGVSDPHCAQGHTIETSTDHRLLWHIEAVLAIAATGPTLRDLQRDLGRYLRATCQHHWHEYADDGTFPAHRQCLWCHDVIWLDEQTTARGGESDA